MKKTIPVALLLLALTAVACTPQAETTPDPTRGPAYDVLIVNQDSRNRVGTERTGCIDKVVWTFDDAEDSAGVSVTFLGETYRSTQYLGTFSYPSAGFSADKYRVVGSGHGGNLLLTENGAVYQILFPFLTLDIRKSDDPDTVRAAAEQALSGEIDFSFYRHCEVYRGNTLLQPPYEEKPDFGQYRFTWYNMKGEYRTDDSCTLTVRSDGAVQELTDKQHLGSLFAGVPDDIMIDPYLPYIEQRLQRLFLFQDGTTRLKEYRINRALIAVYDGRPCFDCFVQAEYRHAMETVKRGVLEDYELLIPLDVLLKP